MYITHMYVKHIIDWREVGQRVRGLRNKPQVEVSRALGITQGQLSRIESGQSRPSIEILLAISLLYHKSVNWILTGKDV
jgi:transcriptional regulator with XRE-family HTH domain